MCVSCVEIRLIHTTKRLRKSQNECDLTELYYYFRLLRSFYLGGRAPRTPATKRMNEWVDEWNEWEKNENVLDRNNECNDDDDDNRYLIMDNRCLRRITVVWHRFGWNSRVCHLQLEGDRTCSMLIVNDRKLFWWENIKSIDFTKLANVWESERKKRLLRCWLTVNGDDDDDGARNVSLFE